MNIKNKKGFTLLELLIVIAIIAILSVILIVVLDPAETLKKARDSQRISDLNSLKTAFGIYLTSTSTPDLDANIANFCLGNGNSAAQIGYSYIGTMGACLVAPAIGADSTGSSFSANFCRSISSAATAALVDGTGWVPVNLTTLIGGSPISNLPLDPINTVASLTAPTSTDLVYRYACQMSSPSAGKPAKAFEFDATLESATYGSGGSDDRSARDGGDNASLYEVGSSVKLMGSGGGF